MSEVQRRLIAIIGTDSSGTSCLAHVLKVLGVDFGDHLHGYYSPIDRGGFGGEDATLVRWCERFACFKTRQITRWKTCDEELKDCIKSISTKPVIGIKHPLLCVAIPEVLKAWTGNLSLVFTQRPLKASVDSVMHRTSGDYTRETVEAGLLWMLQERNKHGKLAVTVNYNTLVDCPIATVSALVKDLSLDVTNEHVQNAVALVRKDLRHHE